MKTSHLLTFIGLYSRHEWTGRHRARRRWHPSRGTHHLKNCSHTSVSNPDSSWPRVAGFLHSKRREGLFFKRLGSPLRPDPKGSMNTTGILHQLPADMRLRPLAMNFGEEKELVDSHARGIQDSLYCPRNASLVRVTSSLEYWAVVGQERWTLHRPDRN